jgi:hypothetical protein
MATGIETGQARNHDVSTGMGKRLFISPKCPDWQWNPYNLLFSMYWRLFSW